MGSLSLAEGAGLRAGAMGSHLAMDVPGWGLFIGAMGTRRGTSGRVGRQPRVERLAVRFVAGCHRVGGRLGSRRPSMNNQLQRASDSVLANIGEGLDAGQPGEQCRFFRYALRSAGEAERLFRGAARLELLPRHEVTSALRLLKDIKMDLRRLITWAS